MYMNLALKFLTMHHIEMLCNVLRYNKNELAKKILIRAPDSWRTSRRKHASFYGSIGKLFAVSPMLYNCIGHRVWQLQLCTQRLLVFICGVAEVRRLRLKYHLT